MRSGAVEVEGEQTSEDPSSVGKPTPSPEGEGEAGGASPSPTGEFGGQGEVIDEATEGPSGTPVPTGEVDLERARRDLGRVYKQVGIEGEKKQQRLYCRGR